VSMHEFEDLVEDSIRILARHSRHTRTNRRDYFAQLYEFQDGWDTGFTEMRVMDLLLDAGYSYRFPLPEHPDYRRFQSYFDGLHEFTFIPGDPRRPYERFENPIACFYAPPFCYCDMGSPLWRRLVEEGTLQGEAAIPPRRVDLAETILEVVTDAFADGDTTLISWWYLVLMPHLYVCYGDDVLSQASSTALARIRQIAFDSGAAAAEHSYGLLAAPPDDFIAESPLLQWWFLAETPMPQ
jgi:hypothetical protein